MVHADLHYFEHYEDSPAFTDALKSGDIDAWKALVEHMQDKLLGFFQRRLDFYDLQTCKDLTQVVWLIAYKKITSFKLAKPDGVLRWLYGIAGYIILRYLRKHNQDEYFLFSIDDVDEDIEILRVAADFPDEDPLSRVIMDELMAQIVECIEEDKPRNQEIFVLRFIHGLSYNEIAEQCGVTPANAAKIVERMRDRLKKRLPIQ